MHESFERFESEMEAAAASVRCEHDAHVAQVSFRYRQVTWGMNRCFAAMSAGMMVVIPPMAYSFVRHGLQPDESGVVEGSFWAALLVGYLHHNVPRARRVIARVLHVVYGLPALMMAGCAALITMATGRGMLAEVLRDLELLNEEDCS